MGEAKRLMEGDDSGAALPTCRLTSCAQAPLSLRAWSGHGGWGQGQISL